MEHFDFISFALGVSIMVVLYVALEFYKYIEELKNNE